MDSACVLVVLATGIADSGLKIVPKRHKGWPPVKPLASQMKPGTSRPLARLSLPMPNGAGMAATKLPNSLAGTDHTSTSIALPSVAVVATMAGRATGPPASAKSL